MKVPLIAKAVPFKGRQKMVIWRNGKQEIVDPPFKPYFYSFDKIDTPAKVSTETKIRLSDGSTTSFYKHEFNTTDDVPHYRIPGKTYEDNIPFVFRVRANNPDFYTEYPNTNELRILQIDIEQYYPEEAFFPTFDDRITNIAYKLGIDAPVIKLAIKKETLTDKAMLEHFLKDYTRYNPDIIEVYNKSYDIPTIIRRMEHNRIDTRRLTRDNTKPYIESGNIPKLSGIVIYDLFDPVFGDQSLNGNVENRGLKAVSDYFEFESKYEVVDFKVKKMDDLVGTQELKDYNEEDVHRLHLLHTIYFPNLIETAEGLHLPLNACTNLKTSDLGSIIMGDLYHKHNIIADGKNKDRYPDIFNEDIKGAKYQGALTGIKKQGLFRPVIKPDFSSLYPNLMAYFNFSPETTKIIGYEPYNINNFKIEDEDDTLIYHIPDNKIKKTVIIQVEKKIGFTTKLIKQFLNNRAKYKATYKKTHEKKYKALSDIEKVKANGGIYGIQGSASHPFGHVPSAIATTGIGRVCIKLLIQTLEQLYPSSVVEFDSITGDTPVFIRDKKTKIIDILPIEDLSDGSLRKAITNTETLTRNGWQNLNYIYCHKVNKNIYTIKINDGEISITEDHSLFSCEKTIRPTSLNTGDIIDLYPRGKDGVITDISYKKKNCFVYDLGTDDGTFVAGKGKIIAHNTDGIYATTNKFNEKDVITLFNKLIKKTFNRDISLDIGFDYYDAGFFHVAKNYILQRGNVIIMHGTAMKASSKCTLERNLIASLARAKIEGKSTTEIISKYEMLSGFALEDFAMSKSMRKPLMEYKSTTSLIYRLIMKGQHFMSRKPVMGNKYYYIKTLHDFELYETVAKQQNPSIDYKYYSKKIKTIVEMFKCTFHICTPLSSFFGAKTESSEWDFDQLEASMEEDHGKLSKFF